MALLNNAYSCDSIVPAANIISDGHYFDITRYKEMIIRTDKAICDAYAYNKRPIVNHDNIKFLGLGFHPRTRSGRIFDMSDQHDIITYSFSPSIVVCLIPKTAEEMKHSYENILPHIRHTKVHGYTLPTYFEQKDYSCSHPDSDYRRTLYWNPALVLDKNGEATIEFYNNSTCMEFSISIEGVTDDGKLIELNELCYHENNYEE